MGNNLTKDSIIEAGTELIAIHGYTATGLDAVLKKAKVPKGSFYHYFHSKEDFGLAVINAYAAEYDLKFDRIFADGDISPLNRIRQYISEGISENTDCPYLTGCLIGNLGQELSAQSEVFRSRIDEIMNGWSARFERCLDDAKRIGELPGDFDVPSTAQFILSGWEGAVLRAKIANSTQPLLQFQDIVYSHILK